MINKTLEAGRVPGRLDVSMLEQNFADLHPPLDSHEALVASDRCYFCHDAPCITACPTDIDIPLFIRQIATGTPEAAAKTIFEQNILGGMCARVCPTETLCEEACVREAAEGKPVEIGRLQRFATDTLMAKGEQPTQRAAPTGKTVGVIGAGPAGLACAHRLAVLGHDVTIYEAKSKGGGLNEFGIAAYKTVDGFAQSELNWLLGIGGIEIIYDSALGKDVTLTALRDKHDAVFLGMGLGAVNSLGLGPSDALQDAVDFISDLRQADNLDAVAVGRDVVVIGGGMTAVDAAVQAKLLGALNVTMVYRRGKEAMNASVYEQDLASSKGVRIIYNAQPVALADNEIQFEYTQNEDGKLIGTGNRFSLVADQVLSAIGQKLNAPEGPSLEGGKIKVTQTGQTTISGVWAGGDCATGGDDLTVTAVAEGRDAAMDIHQQLSST